MIITLQQYINLIFYLKTLGVTTSIRERIQKYTKT